VSVPGQEGIPLKSVLVMFAGIIVMGFSIALIRIPDFGTDPFTCMNLGISRRLNLSFGTWQLILNAVILGVVLQKGRSFIGLGTFVNMAGVGYLADFFSAVFRFMGWFDIPFSTGIKVIILMVSIFLTTLGVAFYMAVELGVAPYDACGLMIEQQTKGRIPFRCSRIVTDIICVTIGIVCGSTVGAGTVILAFFTGPLVQGMKTRIAARLQLERSDIGYKRGG